MLEILISDTKGKIALSEGNLSELGSGGGGDAAVYDPNRCLITDQYGGVTVSTITPNEFRHLAGMDIDIKQHVCDLIRWYNEMAEHVSGIRNNLTSKSLGKLWDKIMAPTGNPFSVNAEGNIDVSSSSLTYVEGIQAQIYDISNKNYGAISPWVTTGFDQVGKILISETNGKVSLSYKTVSELLQKRKPTYTINKCLISDQDGLVTTLTITSNELIHLTRIHINVQYRID